jgi:very-short-patch-repair endonuclease
VTGCNKYYYLLDIMYETKHGLIIDIEVDGAICHSSDEHVAKDQVRDLLLQKEFSIIVIRIPAKDIYRNLRSVLDKIIGLINEKEKENNCVGRLI